MKLFRILFAFDVVALLVLVYFFADGLRHGVGGDYLVIWLPILLVPAGVLAGAWVLRGRGNGGTANLLLGVLALPFLLYLGFVGLFVALDPDMR